MFKLDRIPAYTVTVDGSTAETTGAGRYSEGETVTIHAGTKSGYTFNGWTGTGDVTFADVESDSYYADAVLWAMENGITLDSSETAFSPDVECSRAQIIAFLYRCMN